MARLFDEWASRYPAEYPCGHARTEENSYKNSKVGYRCKTCTLKKSDEIKKKLVSTPEGRKKYNDYNNQQTKKYNKQLRAQMISAYGGKCECCGESEPTFLTLEHKNGGGNAERRLYGGGKNSGSGGQRILLRLRREGWPKDKYTVLCANCNMARKWGPCPHELKRSQELS